MLDKFWESISTNLAGRWLDHIFGPAFLFWAGGLGLYAWQTGWQGLLKDAQALDQVQQIGWIVFSLLVLVFSSMLVQAIRFPVLRMLEGYWPWPFNHLGSAIVSGQKKQFTKRYDELRDLKIAELNGTLQEGQRERMIKLDVWAHWNPVQKEDLLPTALGNTLRARERSPERKYGLDAVICWPRLWPLLPEIVRTDLTNTRASLDRVVELWFWGLLFLVWTVWTPWAALISLLWMVMIYGMARQAAMAYGDLLESAFDLHRLCLYDAIGWSRPAALKEEKEQGKHLTEFLWRGTI
jgi:hypothetical protein